MHVGDTIRHRSGRPGASEFRCQTEPSWQMAVVPLRSGVAKGKHSDEAYLPQKAWRPLGLFLLSKDISGTAATT